MRLKGTPTGRVLTNIRHGGHVIAPTHQAEERAREELGGAEAAVDGTPVAQAAAELAEIDESVTVLEAPAFEAIEDEDFVEGSTRFDYVLSELTTAERYADSHLPRDNAADVVAALNALGDAMVEQDQNDPGQNSPIPPIYTYWGQFIDHDLTANTDRDAEISDITSEDLQALDPEHVRTNLRNLREPALNLDAVYGDGPTFFGQPRTAAADFYTGPKFVIGQVDTSPGIRGVLIPPDDDLHRDLPRSNKLALIADGRNDENLIVAQLHLAFLRFHNAVVDWVREHEPAYATGHSDDAAVFARARRLTEWHYQWLVVNDYLKTVAKRGVAEDVLANGDPRFAPRDGEVFMPLEFSVAGFRFGHSMVRGSYDHNRNFGKPGLNVLPTAGFNFMFTFTGGGGLGGGQTLPFNWVIEWDRFVDKGALDPDRFARKIDTFIAPPLGAMRNQGNDIELPDGPEKDRLIALLKHLARRNLLRGYHLSIPTGQAVAEAMGVTALDKNELADEGSQLRTLLEDAGFLDKTPLWYYVLREAQVEEDGRTLGELGSRLVSETIIGHVRHDSTSYLRQEHPWTPDDGVKLPNGKSITSINDFLRFAGVLM
jgi:hypothetical protein